MPALILVVFISVVLASPVCAEPVKDHGASVRWQRWSEAVFERAKREGRFVLLDLEAVWCHWCHVMDEQTYRDSKVLKLINDHYIAVKVDQDSRPDLANRYEDYGWPATIVFNGQGGEIVKKAGYIAPDEMVSLLTAIVKNPTPGPSVQESRTIEFARDAFLPASLRMELQSKHVNGYDTKYGGWGTFQKFLDWDTLEYSMARARAGDAMAERRAKETLKAQLKLMDPVWGGVYQYSTHGDWDHPHFEKIMAMQAENMRIYAQAFMLWGDAGYLQVAQKIKGYLEKFLLSPGGAFYTSQDADVVQGQPGSAYFKLGDAQRRKQGIPRVDRHMYARENGWAINALATAYAASGNSQTLEEASKALQWAIANRSLPGGGFRHDARDSGGPFLTDTLAMGRAFLSLYAVTADRQWLARAEQAADFIAGHFQVPGQHGHGAGFATSDLTQPRFKQPEPLLDENVMMARFANLLYHYTGKPQYRQLADKAMRFLATPEVARKRRFLVAGVLLADMELGSEPAHITVVGRKDDPAARELFLAAMKYPSTYKRVEWLDRREGPLPNMDVDFPTLEKPAAFACANRRCSLPVFKPEGIAAVVDRLGRAEAPR